MLVTFIQLIYNDLFSNMKLFLKVCAAFRNEVSLCCHCYLQCS